MFYKVFVIRLVMFIDTHCHLSKDDYSDINQVILDNRKSNIGKIIICACSKSSFDEALEIVNRYDDVFLTIGFHPSEASDVTDDDLKYLEEIILSNEKVVGIGEIGLDYHYGKEDILEQKRLFERQLDLASKLRLPVVIHTRDAMGDTIDVLKRHDNFGVIHCFSGSVETSDILINLGYKLGIGGVVTFKNSNLYKVVNHVGVSNIVLETDSPYLAPEPFRGSQNSSKYILVIAKKVAEVCEISEAEVEKTTTLTASKLFDLN